MSIKADRWIRQQCIPPGFMITTRMPAVQNPRHDVYMMPTEELSLSWLSEEQIKAAIDKAKASSRHRPNDALGIVGYRPVTAADLQDWKPMIEPFESGQIRTKGGDLINPPADEDILSRVGFDFTPGDFEMRSYRSPVEKVISYGLSSYGYDVRCANEFKIFTNINSTVVDPKNFDDKCFVDFKGDSCIIPPNSFALARTIEYFRIPRDVLTVCLGKSTYARCGIIVNVTPFEPEWEGHVTLEFSNTTPLPAKIYANEGCAQILFFQGDEPCEVSYKDRGGKYQGQTGITTPKA